MSNIEKFQEQTESKHMDKTFMNLYAQHLMGNKIPGVYISLKHNSKIPSVSFKNIKESTFKKSPYTSGYVKNGNYGILTGYRSKITVVDIDFTNTKKYGEYNSNEFFKIFFESMSEDFETFHVRTPNKGTHYYFKYEPDIKQTTSINGTFVDIRNDGGYCVCAGSTINGTEYKLNDRRSVKRMPKQLKEWILKYQNMEKVERQLSKKATTSIITDTAYNVDIDNETMYQILIKLNNIKNKKYSYVGNYSKWYKIGIACKWANCFKAFDKWSQTTPLNNYNHEELIGHWNSWDCTIYYFMYLLELVHVKNTFTYKQVPQNLHVHKEINRGKIDDIHGNKRFFKPNINYLLKSGTGTGKTTAFMEYMKQSDKKFISIVSRVNLGVEQHRNFGATRDVRLYTNQDFKFGDNIIITPESCGQIQSYDFSNYVIFLDEFNSIIEHIVTSTTLNKRRRNTFDTICKMLISCDQFIAVDADISPISQEFIDKLQVKYKLVNNIYNNFKGIHAKFYDVESELQEKLKGEDKFILCCDSKSIAETYYKLLDDPSIMLITSDTKEDIKNLTSYDRIIFSPKVVYGLDSQKVRPVYAVYSGRTITPMQMVQQLTRERQLTEINIFYPTTTSQFSTFDNGSICTQEQAQLLQTFTNVYDVSFDDYDEDEVSIVGDNEDIFNHIHTSLVYKFDCLRTNTKLHLINILRSRGFNVEYTIKLERDEQSKINKDIKEEIKNDKYENFTLEDEKNKDLNSMLRIPITEVNDYKELFIEQTQLMQHFNYCSFFFKDINNIEENLRASKEFNIVKMKGTKSKLVFLDKLENMIKMKKRKPETFEPKPTKKIKADKCEFIQTQYKALFNGKCSIKNDVDIYNVYTKGLKSLCGDIGTKKKTQINKSRFQLLSLDDTKKAYHSTLFDYRN